MPRRILVIEDDEDALDRIELLLRSNGYSVSAAPTAKAGLELLSREKPEVLILDLNLPDASGTKVVESVRLDKELRGTRILVLTSDSRVEKAAQLLEMGAASYVTKMESNDRILSEVNALCDRRPPPEEGAPPGGEAAP
jgi:DNA-binding response OmpR family regulator